MLGLNKMGSEVTWSTCSEWKYRVMILLRASSSALCLCRVLLGALRGQSSSYRAVRDNSSSSALLLLHIVSFGSGHSLAMWTNCLSQLVQLKKYILEGGQCGLRANLFQWLNRVRDKSFSKQKGKHIGAVINQSLSILS